MDIKKFIHFFRPIYIPITKSKMYFWIKNKPYMSDEKYLKYIFKKQFGYDLPLEDPRSFTEKMQWLKLYDRKPVYTTMVDKILAKEYVASIIGEEYIIPTIAVWDDPDDIDFRLLPDKFVLKCNHNSGGGMVICHDKSKLDEKEVKKALKYALKRNDFYINREWPYKDIKRKPFIEELVSDDNVPEGSNDGLVEYKFYCFNGEPKFLYVGYSNIINNKKEQHLTFRDLEYGPVDFYRSDHKAMPFDVKKPENLEKMIEIARTLAAGTYFVRVDLYNISGAIKFSEFTFFPGGGIAAFEPQESNLQIGEMIWISGKK